MTAHELVNDCDDGNPHSGPTYTTVVVVPEGAATVLGPTPSTGEVQAGGASVPVRISPTATAGSAVIVSWTAVANGCYSANGSTTYRVDPKAPADAGTTGLVVGGAAPIRDQPEADKEGDGGGLNPIAFGGLLALAAAGLATAAQLVWGHRNANATQRAQLTAAVEEAAARERLEKQALAQQAVSREETARLSRESYELAMKVAKEALEGHASAPSADSRPTVSPQPAEELAKKMSGPLGTAIGFLQKFGAKESGVVASPDQVDAQIQQRAQEIAKERNVPAASAEIVAAQEYNAAGGALDRFADGVRGTRQALGGAAAETVTETVTEQVTKGAISRAGSAPKKP